MVPALTAPSFSSDYDLHACPYYRKDIMVLEHDRFLKAIATVAHRRQQLQHLYTTAATTLKCQRAARAGLDGSISVASAEASDGLLRPGQQIVVASNHQPRLRLTR